MNNEYGYARLMYKSVDEGVAAKRIIITTNDTNAVFFFIPPPLSIHNVLTQTPDETVFDVAGNGGFTMNCQELATAVA